MIGNHRIFALLMPRAFEKTNYEMIDGINRRLTVKGDRLFIYHTCTDFFHGESEELGEGKIYEMIPFDIIDAAIIYEEYINDKSMINLVVNKFHEKNIPVAAIGNPVQGCMQFVFDYAAGFEKVVRHMIDYHGYRDIFFLSGLPDNEYSMVREDIVKKVLEEHNVALDDKNDVDYGYFWSTPAREAAKRLLKRGKLPEAIICANDSMATGVCDELGNAGVKIPKEVAISGFDGIDDIYYADPQITSCKCDYDLMAEYVCRSLYDYLSDPVGEYSGSSKVPTKLQVLSSCGCYNEAKISAVEQVSLLDFRIERYLDIDNKFFVMTSKMMDADSLLELRKSMYIEYMKNITLFINPEIIKDAEVLDAEDEIHADDIPDNFRLVYYSDDESGEYIRDVSRMEVHPDINRLIERPFPIVFNVIHLSNKLLGMVMFHHDWNSIENMFLIPRVVTAMRTALTGYSVFRKQKSLSEQLINIYKRDELTGFYLRSSLESEYKRQLRNIKRRGKTLGIMMADLDGLKGINDNYGHSEGDLAILTVARAVHSALPTSAVCFRYGGDEMLAVFEVKKELDVICDDILFYLKRYNFTSGKPYSADVSVGISIDEKPGTRSLEELINEADEIMYRRKQAKKRGKK